MKALGNQRIPESVKSREEPAMKRLLIIALVGLILLQMSACSIGTASKTQASVPPSPEEQDPMLWQMMGDR
jgi:hypothetical protein